MSRSREAAAAAENASSVVPDTPSERSGWILSDANPTSRKKKEELSLAEMQILQRTPYIFGCDECQRFCPFNQKAAPSPLPEIHEHRISTLTKEEMDRYSNRAFDKAFHSYAFAWRGKKILLRNWSIVNKKDR